MAYNLPDELLALMALAPKSVSFLSNGGTWEVRCEHHGPGWRGTRSRWMSPWQHNVQEWAEAIAQVMQED